MALDTTKTITLFGYNVYDMTSEERYGHDDSEAVWTVVCDWADRISLVETILGYSAGGGAVQQITASATYPDAPALKGDNIQVKGIGIPTVGANGKIAWPYAELTITYKTANIGVTSGGVGSMQIDFGGEVLSVPQDQATFKWVSDNVDVPPEASPNLLLTTACIRVPQTRLPKLNTKTVDVLALVDHVNSSTMFGASAGKILYKGASSLARSLGTQVSSGSSAGLEAYDLVHTFLFRSQKWNDFLRPSTGAWEAIVFKGSGGKYFPEADLTSILDQNGIQPGAGIVKD